MRPTCDDNLAHSTILFSNPTTEQRVQRSVGAWPFSNTLLPHLAGWTGMGAFLHRGHTCPVTDGDAFERRALWSPWNRERTLIAKRQWHGGWEYRANPHWGWSLDTWSLLGAQLFWSSTVNCHLDLGATPSVQTTVHQIGTFLNSPLHSTFYTHCTAGRCCPYCASWPAELCYTSGLANWRYTGWVLPALLPGASGLAIRVYSIPWPPSCSGALPPLRVPLASLCVEAAIQDAPGDKAIRAPGSAGFSTGIALKKQGVHGKGLW